MKAMILAAGFGTRLHPLTDTIPKALVPIAGKTILELQLERLEYFGFTEVAVNAHHFAEQVKNELELIRKKSRMKIYYSYEPVILNTGGGIKKMLTCFDNKGPILVQNVDILASINTQKLYESHENSNAKATLVINNNPTDRPLAFNDELDFLGRAHDIEHNIFFRPYCFCGIQIIQPEVFAAIQEEKFYSIDVYCNMAKEQGNVKGFDITGVYWRDIGTLVELKSAEDDINAGKFKL